MAKAPRKKAPSAPLSPALEAALAEFAAALDGVNGRIDTLERSRPKRRGTGSLKRRSAEIASGTGSLRLAKGTLGARPGATREIVDTRPVMPPTRPLEAVVPQSAAPAIDLVSADRDTGNLEAAFSEAFEAHARGDGRA